MSEKIILKISMLTGLFILSIMGYFSFTQASDVPVGFEIKKILRQAPHINPEALKVGLKAYYCAVQAGQVDNPLLTIIDYSKPSTEKRFYVVDVESNHVKFDTLAAHGQGSGDNYATQFSDSPSSHQSSIGVFKTGSTYQGSHGESLRLHGLEHGYNAHALSRAVVIHGAPYVSETFAQRMGRLGRSWGCPALSTDIIKPVIRAIKEGSLVVAYYPNKRWLQSSKYLNC
ncbi:MAG: murein L,D-transpeptidase catalytic domain family protein [Proteobacteria bacterium]|nr:murein L,D-transpeptidase catalytic domain family protein [Pseudomonadota bacterium]